jgi:hypothetical protein
MILVTACLAAALASIHVFVGRLHFLESVPRSFWLSGAGGIAVAYVFLHVLPDLSAHQETLTKGMGLDAELAEITIFTVSLAGLTTFYGLERLAKAARHVTPGRGSVEGSGALWLHLASFALYNTLIGYLLVHPEMPGLDSSLIFFVAMAMHFATNDFGLREHHKERYDRTGRWILAAAVLAGWLLGVTVELPDLAIALLFAFLAGGIVLNVLKEELPEDRKSRFMPFIAGAAGYSILLTAISLV